MVDLCSKRTKGRVCVKQKTCLRRFFLPLTNFELDFVPSDPG
jgi:hypothetical protein